MLLITADIIKPCPKDRNLAELQQVGVRRKETTEGPKNVPVYSGVYVAGLPFGEQHALIIPAPLALQIGDVVRVEQQGYAVWDVKRAGEAIWRSEILVDQEEEKQVAREAKRARKAVR